MEWEQARGDYTQDHLACTRESRIMGGGPTKHCAGTIFLQVRKAYLQNGNVLSTPLGA